MNQPDLGAIPSACPVETTIDSSREPVLRRSECVLILYFMYTAFLAVHFSLSFFHRAAAMAIPSLFMLLAYADSLRPRFSTSIVRDWLPAPLILLAYWQVDWFYSAAYLKSLEQSWLTWDRSLLYQYRLHASAEYAGSLFPAILEISYTLVYAIPPLCIAALYICHRRRRVDAFLFPFLLGVLLSYTLLPHFPSASPRLEFPSQDLPTVLTIWRKFNVWILDRGDIHTSVFPSGHVATAFSAALAMMRALPERKWLFRGLFVEALLVTFATIYGRYHYTADCLVAFALSFAAFGIACAWDRLRESAPARQRWRVAVGIILALFLTPKTMHAQTAPEPRPEITFTVRLESDISTYYSRPGDPIRAIVVADVIDGDHVVMPRGSVLRGQVRELTSIGRGLVHERATLRLEFTEWLHQDGSMHRFVSRLIDVDNAREEIEPDGRIRGILAAGGAPGFLLGMWSRPDSTLFVRTAAGFAGVSRFVCQRAQFSPVAVAGIVALRFAAVPWPEAEIHLPPGTDLVLSARELPARRNYRKETAAAPASESLLTLAAAQPVQTRRGTSQRGADITNVLFIGTREQLVDAFLAAGWWPAEPLTRRSALRVYQAISAQRGYPTAPMSTQLLDGRPADLVFQKSFNTVAKRHHIRIWQQPGEFEGREIWIGAATHDVAMRFRESGQTFTHRIDPMVDRERSKIIDDLTFEGCTEDVRLVNRPTMAGLPARRIVTDGNLAFVTLKSCARTAFESAELHPRVHRSAAGRITSRIVLEARHAILRGNVYYWGYRGARHLVVATSNHGAKNSFPDTASR